MARPAALRLQKKIRIDGNEHRLQIAGREVVLTPPTPNLKIMDSEWFIMNSSGFASEDEARQFGDPSPGVVRRSPEPWRHIGDGG